MLLKDYIHHHVTNIYPSHAVHTPTSCFCRSYLLSWGGQRVTTAQILETAQSKLLPSEMLPNPPCFPSDPPGSEKTTRRERHPPLLQTNPFDPDLLISPTFIWIKPKADADSQFRCRYEGGNRQNERTGCQALMLKNSSPRAFS